MKPLGVDAAVTALDALAGETSAARRQPQAVLAYLARYTHRVAISNSRLVTLDEAGVTFKWKDYRIKGLVPFMPSSRRSLDCGGS